MQSDKMKAFLSKLAHILFKLLCTLLPAMFWFLLMLGFDKPYIAVLTVLCALWHELGHIAALFAMRRDVTLRPGARGFGIGGFGHLSYKSELLSALAGPLANLSAALLLLPFSENGYIRVLAIFNALTALSNLLPVRDYDGYRVLRVLICLRADSNTAERICRRLSLTVTVPLTFLSLYLMLRADSGYWLFFIFIILLFRSLEELRQTICEKTREKTRF